MQLSIAKPTIGNKKSIGKNIFDTAVFYSCVLVMQRYLFLFLLSYLGSHSLSSKIASFCVNVQMQKLT